MTVENFGMYYKLNEGLLILLRKNKQGDIMHPTESEIKTFLCYIDNLARKAQQDDLEYNHEVVKVYQWLENYRVKNNIIKGSLGDPEE